MLEAVLPACLHFVQDFFGSAFFVSADGKVLTCCHCVYDPSSDLDGTQDVYLIRRDARVLKAQLLHHDVALDCALLQVLDEPGLQF